MWKNRTVFYLANLLQLAALFLAVFQRTEVPGWALCLLLLRQEAWTAEPEFEQSMKVREAFIRENYVSLPENLPARVRTLADEITKGAKTDYDRMKAIEEWLSAYAYSTAPAQCPAGQDFTDFFLFESDSGYCTYFATAMAVLGRCSGIPSRYVEGFVSAKTREGKAKTLNLTGSDAHAWAEAYIEHVGWVPFDPTPGYREIADTPWNLPQKAAVSANGTGNTGAGKKPPVYCWRLSASSRLFHF